MEKRKEEGNFTAAARRVRDELDLPFLSSSLGSCVIKRTGGKGGGEGERGEEGGGNPPGLGEKVDARTLAAVVSNRLKCWVNPTSPPLMIDKTWRGGGRGKEKGKKKRGGGRGGIPFAIARNSRLHSISFLNPHHLDRFPQKPKQGGKKGRRRRKRERGEGGKRSPRGRLLRRASLSASDVRDAREKEKKEGKGRPGGGAEKNDASGDALYHSFSYRSVAEKRGGEEKKKRKKADRGSDFPDPKGKRKEKIRDRAPRLKRKAASSFCQYGLSQSVRRLGVPEEGRRGGGKKKKGEKRSRRKSPSMSAN